MYVNPVFILRPFSYSLPDSAEHRRRIKTEEKAKVVASVGCGGSCEMWWFIGSAPDFWGRIPGFKSGISHNDPGVLLDHCVTL